MTTVRQMKQIELAILTEIRGEVAPAPTLDSKFVPQANKPERLVEILERIRDGLPVDATAIGVVERQVDYYTDAVKLLGFLSPAGRLTCAGRALLSLDVNARWARFAIAFEHSVCGQAWVEWYRAKSLCNVDHRTAKQFLTQAAGLSGEMLVRRSGTLSGWWRAFVPFHPARQSEPAPRTRQLRLEALGQTAVLDTRESARVVQALGPGTALLRVATGFLSIGGFEILAAPLRESWLRLLVGYDAAVLSVADILKSFRRSIEDGPPSSSKQSTLRNLHHNMSTGQASVRYFDPRHKPHVHAKVYLFDEYAAFVTSANLSNSGLRTNIEGGYVVRDSSSIEYFRTRFDELFEAAQDLRKGMLDELEKSWVFHPLVEPYLLYLYVLLALYPRVDDLSHRSERQLAKFQELIVGAVLQSLREHRGALLVSPTGTGKTVMSGHIATVLQQRREIERIFVLCPNEGLKRKWKAEADQFRVHMQVITHGIVQGKGKPSDGVEKRLQRELSRAHSSDLVIVDESHVFRNPETNGFENLDRFVGQRSNAGTPRLLLLSATPMSKGLDDLNAQLTLVGAASLDAIDGVARSPGVVNVTLPFIIKHFGTDGRGGPGIALEYPQGLLYFGRIRTATMRYPATCEAVFEHIEKLQLRFRRPTLDFRQMQVVMPGIDVPADARSRSASGLLKLILLRRAESSPRAARETVERLINPPDDWPLEPDDPAEFRACLEELLRLLPAPEEDQKLCVLVTMLKARPKRQRVLIFSMWSATVNYLAETLPALLGGKARTARITGEMPPEQRRTILQRFAPTAQGLPHRSRKDDIDILIATDAIAEGQDLQDADVLVNYDLPWTPLLLVQRVGRVDRPTKRERQIDLWNFYPSGDAFERQVRLWHRLDGRADLYARMSKTHVIGEHDRQLGDLAAGDLGLVGDFYADKIDFAQLRLHYAESLPTSELLRDRASASKENEEKASALPIGIRSCKAGSRAGIFALLRVGQSLSCVFRPEAGGDLEVSPGPSSQEALLQNVRTAPETTLMPLPSRFDEDLVALVEEFAISSKVDVDEVTVVATEAIIIAGLARPQSVDAADSLAGATTPQLAE